MIFIRALLLIFAVAVPITLIVLKSILLTECAGISGCGAETGMLALFALFSTPFGIIAYFICDWLRRRNPPASRFETFVDSFLPHTHYFILAGIAFLYSFVVPAPGSSTFYF